MAKSHTFYEWARNYGTRNLAEDLDTDITTVRRWLRGACWPRVHQMRKIKKLAKGKITYADIIDGGQ